MMKIRLTKIHYLLSLIFGLWLGVAQAQFQVGPMVIQTNTTRGMAHGMIEVKNVGRETAHLRVYSEPFTYDADGFKSLKTSPQDLSHYLVYAPRQLRIRPGQKRRIRLNVRFLPSTKLGEYRAMIFTEDVKPHQSDTPQMGVVPRIGTAVFVRHGNIKPQLSVQGATYKDKRIVLRVNNTGKATARPRVNWVLKKSWREIATGRSNVQTVIAQGQRNVQIKSPEIEGLRSGTYQLSGELVWGAGEKNELPFQQQVVVPW
ncbi:MAG: P pilus assembly protein, chaperone PapD [Candidatus Parabeggiatoa sp. nov. 1]|nr:MAG: P pilus assembly protein, chaperone PapD [Gammaproteobacteria bacterium]